MPGVMTGMARKKRRKKSTDARWRNAVLPTVLLLLLALSLLVRWGGILPPDERLVRGLRLEVLNGTGEQGLAKRTALALRRRGIDVLIVGDADSYDFPETLVIDRRGGDERVRTLARIIRCRRVLEQVQERPLVDATLVIGGDYGELGLDDGS